MKPISEKLLSGLKEEELVPKVPQDTGFGGEARLHRTRDCLGTSHQ